MNKMFAILPLAFLTACGPEPIDFAEFEVRLVTEKAATILNDRPPYRFIGDFSVVIITCKSDKPLNITAVSVNGRDPIVPNTNEPIEGDMPMNYFMRWIPQSEQKDKPVTLQCHKGQREMFVGAWSHSNVPEERRAVIDVTIQTADRGWVKYAF